MKYKQWLFVALVLGLGLTFVVMAYGGSNRVLGIAEAVRGRVFPSPTPTPTVPAPAGQRSKGKTQEPQPTGALSGEAIYDQQYNANGRSDQR